MKSDYLANYTTSTNMPTIYPSKKKFKACFVSAETKILGLSDCYTEDISADISRTYVSTTPMQNGADSTKERMKVLYLCDDKVIYNPSDESAQGRLKWLGIVNSSKQYCSSPIPLKLISTYPISRRSTVNSSPSNCTLKTPIPIRLTPITSASQVMSINVTSSTSPLKPSEDYSDFSSKGRKRSYSVTTTTINILYAEDNIFCRNMTTSLIAKLTGIQCDTVKDGLECYKKVEENPEQYQLILMDVLMPIMGGIDATERIRQLGLNIPIIAVSHDESEGIEQRCTTAGMNGFLKKPLTISKLKEVISQQQQQVDPV